MKNKTKKALCAISILGVIAISGIFAYLTDSESKENVFTIGNVDIELLEPSWPTEDLHGDAENDDGPNGIPDAVENLVPNQVVAKDPQVKNVGKNNAYVFMRVQTKFINTTDLPLKEADGSEKAYTNMLVDVVPSFYDNTDEGFLLQAFSRHWVVLPSLFGIVEDTEGNRYINLVFAYKDELEPGETTPALCDGIKINNVTEAARGLEGCVKVEAFAIQKDGLPADIAEDLETLTDIDIDMEDVTTPTENGLIFTEAMEGIYDIIMNQNPDAQPAEFTPIE